MEKLSDPIRSPIARLSEAAAAELVSGVGQHSYVVGEWMIGPIGTDDALADALRELREKVLR